MSVQTSTKENSAHIYYEKKLLSVLEPRLVLQPLGKKQRLPKGNGKRVDWLRYSTIAEDVNHLDSGTLAYPGEGQVPQAISFETSRQYAEIKQYGQYTKVSDLLTDTAIDPVLDNLSERFGIAASKTIEKLIVDELDNGATQMWAGAATNDASLTSADTIKHLDLVKAMITQKAAYIGPHESGDYVAVLNPKAEYDLLTDVTTGSFLDINKYTDKRPLLNGEIGRMYGMRFLVSDKMSEAAANGSGIVPIANYVIGEEAFGVVELNGDAMKMIIKRHGSAGALDPLDQFATVGYKINGFAVKYLAETVSSVVKPRVIQLRSASSLD